MSSVVNSPFICYTYVTTNNVQFIIVKKKGFKFELLHNFSVLPVNHFGNQW